MKYQPYNNLTIDFATAPLVAFYKDSEGPNYTVQLSGEGSKMAFDPQRVVSLKKAVENYNAQGGRYYWLFNNVAINLDVVNLVWALNGQMVVEYPGGKWVSSQMGAAEANRIYKSYCEHIADKTSPTPAARKAEVKKTRAADAAAINEAALAAALENIDRMIGLDGAKKDIRQNIALARFNAAKQDIGMAVKPISRHMVFTGNPGTGKTTFAREVAKIYHALGFLKSDKVVEAKREDLVGEYTGHTAPKVQKKLEEARGGVLFIDEAYSLARDGSAFRDVYGTEAIDTLVAGMENMREELVVIVAGYPEPMRRFIAANEGLKSRFVTYIAFEDYSMDALGQIMDLMAGERDYTIASDARAHLIDVLEKEKAACEAQCAGDETNGSAFGNARDARTLIEAAEKAMALRLNEQGAFSPDHGMDAEARRAALSTITLDDVKNLSLQGLRPDATPQAKPTTAAFRPRSAPAR